MLVLCANILRIVSCTWLRFVYISHTIVQVQSKGNRNQMYSIQTELYHLQICCHKQSNTFQTNQMHLKVIYRPLNKLRMFKEKI